MPNTAMSVKEWQNREVVEPNTDRDVRMAIRGDGVDRGLLLTPCGHGQPDGPTYLVDDRRHAFAALALYGQRFGFTSEDVELLRDVADENDEQIKDGRYPNEAMARRYSAVVRGLADRIAALLPPQ